jgi:hypothetical protein
MSGSKRCARPPLPIQGSRWDSVRPENALPGEQGPPEAKPVSEGLFKAGLPRRSPPKGDTEFEF